LTFQETKPTGFPPKTSPWRLGCFFFQTQLQHPKDDENPRGDFWRFWRMAAWGLGNGGSVGDQRERRAAEEGAFWEEKHVVTCN